MQPIRADKFTWENLMVKFPADHQVFSHQDCWGCVRNGLHLRASTIKHIGLVIANAAEQDGSQIRRGVQTIAANSARRRATVIAAMGHLQVHGLLRCVRLGGGRGARRGSPSEYELIFPDAEILTVLGEQHAEIYRQMQASLRQSAATGMDWFYVPPKPKPS